MINASEIVNHKQGLVYALSQLFKPSIKSPLTLVRIACHMHEFESALPACLWLKEMGYEVGVNLMQIADRSKKEIEKVAYLASQYPIDVLYFADSMGSMSPDHTSDIISTLRLGWEGPLGIHTHDNMGRAMANSMCAVSNGVTWIDSTVTGMGRGPGNVQTEYLAIEMAEFKKIPLNLAPLLSVIDKHFKPLQSKYCWGMNPYYYLSGKYCIHPSFIQEMLSDSRYDDEDLFTVIDNLREIGGKKFSIKTLESGRNFYKGEPIGSWSPYSLIHEKEVLIIGAGPSANRHRKALEDFITNFQPIVIALNTQVTVRENLIDIRAASHPVRLLADCSSHITLPQPLVIPESMLPESILSSLEGKRLLDFGIAIESDTQLLIPKKYLKRILKYFYLSLVFQNNHVFGLAGGNYSHKDLFRYYGMKEDRIFLMPMMVDNSKFYVEKKNFSKPFIFLFVGRLLDTKNVDKLCQQFISLFLNKKAKIIIVGDGDNLEKYKKTYSQKNIIFMGSVFSEELIDIYKNASVFTFPSSLDAWGLVVNEALSAGLPVIARKEVGACSDLIDGKKTGFIVEDMKDFGQMMLTLFDDSELLKNYSKNASDLMRNNWNYNLYAQCMLKFIRALRK